MTAATRWESCALGHVTRVRDRLDEILLGDDYDERDLDRCITELGRAATETEIAKRWRDMAPSMSLDGATKTVQHVADRLANEPDPPGPLTRQRLAHQLREAAAAIEVGQ